MAGAKKSFGQHFLKDEPLLKRIVEAAEIGSDDQVVEIGPGRGALTAFLPQDRLTLVEADRDLVPDLQQRFGSAAIMQADATSVEYDQLVGDKDWILIGNLPYNVGNAIIMKALQASKKPTRLVVMLQKEVADRMMAKPGSTMSVLSVAVQLYGNVTKVMDVKPGSFQPPPNVMSSVIRIDVAPKTDAPEEVISLASAGFSARRKQLHKNLSSADIASSQQVKSALGEVGLREDIRAQDLSIQNWIDMWRVLGA